AHLRSFEPRHGRTDGQAGGAKRECGERDHPLHRSLLCCVPERRSELGRVQRTKRFRTGGLRNASEVAPPIDNPVSVWFNPAPSPPLLSRGRTEAPSEA